jgi:3-oxoacyl-[acyl-carrier-protein] synthase-3
VSAQSTRILGLGHYLPPKVVTNEDLAKMFDTTDAWIQQRSGIKERRYSEGPDDGTAAMGAKAARAAVDDAGLELSDIDFIVFATLSPDYTFPGSSALAGDLLGLNGVAAMDIRNQCTGFIYGLTVADSLIRAGHAHKVLVIGSEVHSTGLDFSDRGRAVTVLFGDGAGAAVVGASEDDQRGLMDMTLHCDGAFAKALWVEGPASVNFPQRVDHEMLDDGRCFPSMQGRVVFKEAVTKLHGCVSEVLGRNGLSVDDVALFVPHQANMRINQMVAGSLGLPEEKVVHNIERYGNTTAATIPIGLSESKQEGRIQDGDLVLIAAFGAGFTWGAGILRW